MYKNEKKKISDLAKFVDFADYVPENKNDIVYYYDFMDDVVRSMKYNGEYEVEVFSRVFKTKEEAVAYGRIFMVVDSALNTELEKRIDETISQFAEIKPNKKSGKYV